MSKDAKKLLYLMYEEYKKRRKQGFPKQKARHFGSSVDVHRALMSAELAEDVLEYLRELGRLGYTDNMYADDIVYECSLSSMAIAELDSMFVDRALSLAEFVSKFIPLV